jgi:hypothetical protein
MTREERSQIEESYDHVVRRLVRLIVDPEAWLMRRKDSRASES